MKKIIIVLLLQYLMCFAQEIGARYLIITHDDYYNALLPLAEWKTQKGLKAKIVTLSEIGGSSQEQIKNFVVNAYNTWQTKPEYLLLVGNDDQIPFPQINYAYTDNYYTNMDSDYKNEIIPGRFWVSTTDEAMTVVAKVLGYDKNPHLDDSLWFRKGVTIVCEAGSQMSAPIYWADARYVHDLLLDAGFIHIDSFSDIFGNSSLDVVNAINDGRSYVLYRGLAGGTWSPPFAEIYPANMNNGFKLPIVVSATCATVEGIGKDWQKAGTPEQANGVVGFLGTTTYLDNAAELRSALTQGSFESIFCDSFTTIGKACEHGRQTVYNLSLLGSELEYNSWTCLGDPEMTVWTTTPRPISVNHTTMFEVGVCTVSVDVQHNSIPIESALVCISAKNDTTFYEYGRTNNSGSIICIDTCAVPGDSVFITVTGRNLKPYHSAISVYYSGGPYVLLNSFSILDNIGGNDDSVANPGENLEIPIWLRNWGDSTAYNVSAVIRKIVPDLYFTLDDTAKIFGNILTFDSAYTSDNGYNVIIAPNCPDTHQINLQLAIHDTNNSTWISNFNFVVHAPIIIYDNYYFPGNLKYTPAGDTDQLIIELENIGSCQAENVTGKIFSDDSLCNIIDSISSFGTITSNSTGSNQSNPFVITTDPTTPAHHQVAIKLEVVTGVYIDTLDLTFYVGQKDYLIWDPDPNHSSGPIIKSKLDSLDFYGDYSTTFSYGLLSLYKSLFVCLGYLGEQYVIYDTNQAGQEIEQYLVTLGGKAYLEGGEVWYGDPHNNYGYDFGPLFCIQPVSNVVGITNSISGTEGSFTQSMSFNYSGAGSIDRIAPTGNGISVLRKNSSNDTIVGVAANNQTVGTSFELGNLVDGVAPSTKVVLLDSIMKYFGILPTGTEENKMSSAANSRPSLIIYPNPCCGVVNLKLQIPILQMLDTRNKKQEISLKIYDVSGRVVKSYNLASNLLFPASTISWDGTDDLGRTVNQGVYFIKLATSDFEAIKKIVFLR